VDSLTLNPANVKKHDRRSVRTIASSLLKFGQRAPLVATTAGVVLVGNGRLMAARELGWSHVAVLVVDDDEHDAEAYALVDNRSAEVGSSWDWEALSAALARQVDQGRDLTVLGWLEHEAEPLLKAEFTPTPPEDSDGRGRPIRPVSLSPEQREVFERALAKVREDQDDPTINEGRALELICADFLAG